MLEKEKESINQLNQEDLPREGFHLDHVKMYWKQYAFQLKENGMETFYNALIKRDPILKSEETLELVVDNLVQQNYIQTHLLAFKDFMRKQLRNYHLDIQITLSEAGDEEVKFLTGKDKFAALARKNPNLHTLKNRFNLDIDYWFPPIGIYFRTLQSCNNKCNHSYCRGNKTFLLNSKVRARLGSLRFLSSVKINYSFQLKQVLRRCI